MYVVMNWSGWTDPREQIKLQPFITTWILHFTGLVYIADNKINNIIDFEAQNKWS